MRSSLAKKADRPAKIEKLKRPRSGKIPARLTVGDIAKRLATLVPDTELTKQRVRHWTRIGVLLPFGRRKTGTGIARRYDEGSVFDAAVLSRFADLGRDLASLECVHQALALAREWHRNWDRLDARGVLAIKSLPSGGGILPFAVVHQHMAEIEPVVDWVIAIPLAQLAWRIRLSPRSTT
jgi:hypothetical protein